MEAEKIIKEKEIVHEDEHRDYASKGVGNAGLTLGIIGTALGAWAVSILHQIQIRYDHAPY